MIHTLISSTAAVTAAVPISKKNAASLPSLTFHKICSSHSHQLKDCRLVDRRSTTLGLVGLVLGFTNVVSDKQANAAARRPPPPPPQEKKDPSINATTAKVLASKKRKEALKEAAAKLREKGKVITKSPQ